MARLLTALALVASAGAFAPAATQTRSASALSAYVPQGLSASEYAAKKAADASKKQANKSRFPKGKNLVKDVADWLVEMEAKQTFKGDQVAGSGHTFAKEKFTSKAAFDVANGRRDKGYGGANKASGSAPAPKKKAFGLF